MSGVCFVARGSRIFEAAAECFGTIPCRNKSEQEIVIEQQDAEREHEVIQEGVVGGEDDAEFPRRDDEEADEAHAARKKEHEDEAEFQHQRARRSGGVKPMWQMLDVPADPGGQRAVLVVLVHRGEVAPLRIAAEQLDHAGFEVDAEPLPLQEEQAGARRRMVSSPAGPDAARREEECDEAGFEQHAVGLIAGEVAG